MNYPLRADTSIDGIEHGPATPDSTDVLGEADTRPANMGNLNKKPKRITNLTNMLDIHLPPGAIQARVARRKRSTRYRISRHFRNKCRRPNRYDKRYRDAHKHVAMQMVIEQ